MTAEKKSIRRKAEKQKSRKSKQAEKGRKRNSRKIEKQGSKKETKPDNLINKNLNKQSSSANDLLVEHLRLFEAAAADGPGNHKIAQGYSNQPVMSVPMKTLSQGRATRNEQYNSIVAAPKSLIKVLKLTCASWLYTGRIQWVDHSICRHQP